MQPNTRTKPNQDEASTGDLESEQLRAIVMSAWRPAWSIRRRVGCLAPFIAWWKSLRANAR